MNMTATAEALTDDAIRAIYTELFGRVGSSLRDSNGNLRDFTEAEEAFRAAIKAERFRRFAA